MPETLTESEAESEEAESEEVMDYVASDFPEGTEWYHVPSSDSEEQDAEAELGTWYHSMVRLSRTSGANVDTQNLVTAQADHVGVDPAAWETP